MKLELKKNMYVRTKDGIIAKVDYIDDDTIFFDKDLYRTYSDSINFLEKGNLERIVKTSYNIIEILEENDYINGLRIEKNKYGELYTSYVYYGGNIGKQCEVYTIWLKEMKEDMIYSIITHEQMEQMEYKVGE